MQSKVVFYIVVLVAHKAAVRRSLADANAKSGHRASQPRRGPRTSQPRRGPRPPHRSRGRCCPVGRKALMGIAVVPPQRTRPPLSRRGAWNRCAEGASGTAISPPQQGRIGRILGRSILRSLLACHALAYDGERPGRAQRHPEAEA
eukprot:3421306-Prymnesium_polylepis.1